MSSKKIRLLIEYEGTQYCGWQCQPNGLSVQEVLEKCLLRITKTKTTIYGSGRTDSGVHAEGHVAHFHTKSRMTPLQFMKAMNSLLPRDIKVREVKTASTTFHARRSAKWKLYRYRVLNRDSPSALHWRQGHYAADPLDVPAMRRAARALVGDHDFSAFRGAGCGAKCPIRRIHCIRISKKQDCVVIDVEGNAFLKYMVRIIVGTLLEVGFGTMTVKQVRQILESRDRIQAGPTAPSRGLCLVHVGYTAWSPEASKGR